MTDQEKIAFKSNLKEKAIGILEERLRHAQSAMRESQESANNEDKSTVGDKHETSRSMALLDREIYARQFDAAQKELSLVHLTDVSKINTVIAAGTYVATDNGNYFFIAGLGATETSSGKIFFLSIHSPIGHVFENKKAGDDITFNGKRIRIDEVF